MTHVKQPSGKLIVFEGANEVGKSTLAALLYTSLKTKGVACDLFAFPGNVNGTLGRHVYELHHGAIRFGINRVDPTSLQVMHAAAHIDAIESTILPALTDDRIVILDRFWWSAWVYGTAHGAHERSLELIVQLEQSHWGVVRPAVIFLVTRQSPVTPMYEMTDWRKVANLYSSLARRERGNDHIKIIQNDGPLDVTFEAVAQVIGDGGNLLLKAEDCRPGTKTRRG
jgi:dTMP kinase